ncbi:uncharacterized protein LOC119995930 isoform X1 [Tripterygium wilfordii]|uniref:uncharacterized protein LOC119995930 isoform X1 n=2 Tax=Tripterygium wilfordii TaxID=458696 RepID=UPI0018F85A4D|nr:uncharacterized protein LOC119995930 isoform X1 [Tripterygium wilfordii]
MHSRKKLTLNSRKPFTLKSLCHYTKLVLSTSHLLKFHRDARSVQRFNTRSRRLIIQVRHNMKSIATRSEVLTPSTDLTLDDSDDELLDAYMSDLEKNANAGGGGSSSSKADNDEEEYSGDEGASTDEGDSGDVGDDSDVGQGNDVEVANDDDHDEELVYESEDCDMLLYEYDSDDEVRVRGHGNPKYDPKVKEKEYVFQLGMEFKTLKDFKEAVRGYAVDGGYQIQMVRNDKLRCKARCDNGCPWMIWCSQIRGKTTYQIKTYIKKHRCNRMMPNKQANSSWLATRMVDKIRSEPKISATQICTYAKEHMSLAISRTHAYRAKKKALDIIQGKHNEQYGQLRSYFSEVLRTNRGSTCNIIVDRARPEDPAVFKRAYVCLAALKKGFIEGCRPLIGLDGCFLKTVYGGQLLTAIAQDGSNGLFLIAWAVVDRENGDSWDWFLRKLLLDIGGFDNNRWCFISDRQKGLVQAIEGLEREMQQRIEHRFCVRHIYANFSKQWPGAHFRWLVYECAKSTTMQGFNIHMQKIKDLDEAAWKYLSDIRPCLWTRVAFSTFSKNDSIVNNMSESFNSMILPSRDRPIITLLEKLRADAMDRHVMLRETMSRKQGVLVPEVHKILDKEFENSRLWTAKWTGDDQHAIFQVSKKPEQYIVNVERATCTCRAWDLSGIPCTHAVAAIGWCTRTQLILSIKLILKQPI